MDNPTTLVVMFTWRVVCSSPSLIAVSEVLRALYLEDDILLSLLRELPPDLEEEELGVPADPPLTPSLKML